MPPIYVGRGHYEMIGGICLCVCHVPRPNSTTERPSKLKIGRMESNLEVKRSKVKVTRATD